jgi:hypothetical protein
MFLRNFSGILDNQWIPFVGAKHEKIQEWLRFHLLVRVTWHGIYRKP